MRFKPAIMQVLDWNDFRAFLAVARAGRLVTAAHSLKVDPTTLGRRLRRLEARMGASLFEQTREGQTLTEAGEALLVRVESMAQAVAGLEESGEEHGGLSGTLRISVPEGFGTAFLAPRLAAFANAHPGLTIDLVASNGFLSPSRREADIAVMLSRPKSGRVVSRKLSDYQLALYAAPEYLAQRGTPGRPPDLAEGHRLVGYVPDLLENPELRYLDEIHPGLAAALRSPSIVAQLRVISSGAGIGVLPCFMAEQHAGLVRVLPEQTIVRTFWLVTHRDTQRLARVRAGKDWIAETVRRNRERLLPHDGRAR